MKVCIKGLAVTTLFVCFMIPAAFAQQWEITIVDGTTTEAGQFCRLELDQYDLPHIAYRMDNPDTLKYAYLQVTDWIYEVPQNAEDTGEYIDLTLDSMDRAFISHFSFVQEKLLLTYRPGGGALDTEPVGSAIPGVNTSIDLQATENPTITYYNYDSDYVRCARGTGGGWVFYNVAAITDNSFTDLKIDPQQMMHVLYNDGSNQILYYSKGDGSTWVQSIIDTQSQVPSGAIELDSNGNPHIVYIEANTSNLRYAWYDGVVWNYEVAFDVAGSAIDSVTLALDSNDVPHVCFYSLAETLVYANRVGGTWQGDAIDDDGDVGLHCSMDIDSNDYVHVAYYDRDQKNLKYARMLPPKPTPTPTMPPSEISTKMVMEDNFMTAGETFLLERTYTNNLASATPVDEYILLDILNMYWYWPTWSETLNYSQWTVPVGGPTTDAILTFEWPVVAGEFSGIRFWGAFLAANTTDLLSYDMIEWGYGETPPPLTLTSKAFANGQSIPMEYTCDAADNSPDLTWNNPSQTVQSFAIIMDDPDAPGGDWVHWVIYDIPTETLSLPNAVPNDPTLADGSVQGNNSWDSIGYRGPCPPSGPVHRYFFKLYALDTMTGMASGSTKAELLSAMEGHILYQTELMGTYQH